MKVRNLYFGAAVAAVALCASAEAYGQQTVYVDETVAVTEFECDNNDHYFSNWRNNWFIQLGAGINQPFVERGDGVDRDIKAIDRKRMTVAYNFGFGRWFSPYIGFRINAIGGALHWDNPTKAQPYNGWTRGQARERQLRADVGYVQLAGRREPQPCILHHPVRRLRR